MSADKKERLSKKENIVQDIWGQMVEEIPVLKDRYSWYPVNVLYTPHADWNKRRRKWRDYLLLDEDNFGIQASEIEEQLNFDKYKGGQGISKVKIASEAVFDPMLLEILADWYCPENGTIFDTFNGSHVSGCVFQKLGYRYTGIDIRQSIIDQNNEKVKRIIPENPPEYICGDANDVLDDLAFDDRRFDFYNSCPPYADLVRYSKANPIKGDISMVDYKDFVPMYRSIIHKACSLINHGGYACYTIGQIRDKKTGGLLPFREDTIKAFQDAGMLYYNDVPLIGPLGSAAIRAKGTFERGKGKLVNVHQIVLVFKKV
jgi:hypothetical protein